MYSFKIRVMEVNIRKAVKEDCSRILELVKELAIYERAPKEVTVTLDHFEKSGFDSRASTWNLYAKFPSSASAFSFAYLINFLQPFHQFFLETGQVMIRHPL